MDLKIKSVVTREIVAFLGFVLSWFITILLFAVFVSESGNVFLYNVSFYFFLLYCFYLFNRLVIWVIGRFFFREKQPEKRSILDSIAMIFILVGVLAYFVILLSYRFVIPMLTG